MADTPVNPTGVKLVPDPTATPQSYPSNPGAVHMVNPGPNAGNPLGAPTISQGIQLMEPCSICGAAFPPDQIGTHQRLEAQMNSAGMFDFDNGAEDNDGDDDQQKINPLQGNYPNRSAG